MAETETKEQLVAFEKMLHGYVSEEDQPTVTQAMREGRAAHALGKPYSDHPKPRNTTTSLAWRIGWNEAALRES